jgi:hypothetical protein
MRGQAVAGLNTAELLTPLFGSTHLFCCILLLASLLAQLRARQRKPRDRAKRPSVDINHQTTDELTSHAKWAGARRFARRFLRLANLPFALDRLNRYEANFAGYKAHQRVWMADLTPVLLSGLGSRISASSLADYDERAMLVFQNPQVA